MMITLKISSILVLLANLTSITCAKTVNSTGSRLFKCKNASFAENDSLELPSNLMFTKVKHQFKLVKTEHELPCDSSQRVPYNIPWNNSQIPYGDLFQDNTYIKAEIYPDGTLMITNSSQNGTNDFTTYHLPMDFCIQETEDTDKNVTLSLEVCNTQKKCPKKAVENSPPCIRKCCRGVYETLVVKSEPECAFPSFDPEGNNSLKRKPFQLEIIERELNGHYHKTTNLKPKYFHDSMYMDKEYRDCTLYSLKLPVNIYAGEYYSEMDLEVFHLEDDGMLSVCDRGKWKKINPELFCIDALFNFGEKHGESGNVMSLAYMHCSDSDRSDESDNEIEEPKNGNGTRHILVAIAVSIACFFLFITCLVYVVLWDKQNVQGYSIFFYIISLFFTYLFFAIAVLLRDPIGTSFCKFVGISLHFSFISTFSWLTTVGFNIWWTFKEVKMPTKRDHLGRIAKYAIFAWSIPLVVVSIGLILDHINSENELVCSATPVPRPLSPKYGQRSCGVSEEAQGVYMYYFAAVFLGCNLVFYFMTVSKLHQYRKNSNFGSERDQSVFLLYGKLFIVLGVCWIFEFVGWLTTIHNPDATEPVLWFVFSMDMALCLQSFALFVIFVCKRTIFDQLWEKYPMLRSFLSPLAACGCRHDALSTGNEPKTSKASGISQSTSMNNIH